MASKNNPYDRIRNRFVEARFDDRGFDDTDDVKRERVGNRFNQLAKTVEGRGKIAQQILGENATPEKTKALRQRIKNNLPKAPKKDSTPAIVVNPTAPRTGSPGAGGSRVAPKAPTQSTVIVGASSQTKKVTGEFGSIYEPGAFANWAADTKIPIYGDIFGTGIPVARVIRQGAKELDEAYLAFEQGEVKEGFKNVAGVGREVLFGSLDALGGVGTTKFAGKLSVKGARVILPKLVGNRFAKAAGKGIDDLFLGGAAQSVFNRFRKPSSPTITPTVGPATVVPVRPTPPVRGAGSTPRRTSTTATPTPTPTVTPTPAVTPKTPKAPKAPKTPKAPKAKKAVDEQALLEAEFGPVKFADAVGDATPTAPVTPVTPATPATPGSNPPTPYVKLKDMKVPEGLPEVEPFVSSTAATRAQRKIENQATQARINAQKKANNDAIRAANPQAPKPPKEPKPPKPPKEPKPPKPDDGGSGVGPAPKAPKGPKPPKPDAAKIEMFDSPAPPTPQPQALPGSKPPTPYQKLKDIEVPEGLPEVPKFTSSTAPTKAQRTVENKATQANIRKLTNERNAKIREYNKAKGSPAQEGVVGGADPKAPPTPEAGTVPPPQKQSGPKKKSFTSGFFDEGKTLQRRPVEVVDYVEYPDPNMRGGVAKKTTLKSQAVSMQEEAAARAVKKPVIEMFGDSNPVGPAKKPAEIVMFKDTVDSDGIPHRELVDPRAKAIQDSMLVLGDLKKSPSTTLAAQRRIQQLAAEEATRLERLEIKQPRRTPRERREIQKRYEDELSRGEAAMPYAAAYKTEMQLLLESQKRSPSKNATIKTRRIDTANTPKAMNASRKRARAEANSQGKVIEKNGVVDESATRAVRAAEDLLDTRSSQQIMTDIDQKVQNILNSPPPPLRTGMTFNKKTGKWKQKTPAEIKKQRLLDQESAARMQNPDVVEINRTNEKIINREIEEIREYGQRLTTAKQRAKNRAEIAGYNEKGIVPDDNTSGIRGIFEDDALIKRKNSAGETVRVRAKDTLDVIYQGESGVQPRQQQRPYSLPPPETPPPPNVAYADRGQQPFLSYEDLLKIESETFVSQRIIPGLSQSDKFQISTHRPRLSYEYVIDRKSYGIESKKFREKGPALRGYFRPTYDSPGMSETALRSTGVTKADLVEMMKGSLERIDKSSAPYRKAKNK